jgi:hypothetical protein
MIVRHEADIRASETIPTETMTPVEDTATHRPIERDAEKEGVRSGEDEEIDRNRGLIPGGSDIKVRDGFLSSFATTVKMGSPDTPDFRCGTAGPYTGGERFDVSPSCMERQATGS